MGSRVGAIQELIGRALGQLPDVFSTVQWGGRAYKLPGPNGNRKKPKLLAHVCLNRAGDAVCVDFKLERKRAADIVEEFDWISPHSFRTLAPSGWVSAEVRVKSRVKTVATLLRESRSLYPECGVDQESSRNRKRESEVDSVMRRISVVLSEKRATGWSPDRADFSVGRVKAGR